MSSRGKRRAIFGAVVLVVLALVVPPSVHFRAYHARIAGAIGNAIGRRVTVGDVALRLVPQPGFELQNVTIADDPAFSAEPMITAGEVDASLRLSSLWRGRLEIAELSFQEPSVNLVRAADGRWNFEALLVRASQTPSAPTGRARPEARPRFPYVEADTAHVNFRLGDAKKPFALHDADFALWLAAENRWNFRLEAAPVRTDTSVSDTGTVKVAGEFQRAAELRETPFKAHVEWQQAQLGQLTKLLAGRDHGWRGGVNLSADLSGNLSAIAVIARGSVDEFRRYDIAVNDSLRIAVNCRGSYRAASEALTGIDCSVPFERGELAIRGGITGLFGARAYDLNFTASDITGPSLVAVARHVKKNLPDDLSATADFDAAFTLRTQAQDADIGLREVWTGVGSIANLVVRSRVLPVPLDIGDVDFKIAPPAATTPARRGSAAVPPMASLTQVAFPGFRLPLGMTAPVTVQGTATATGYSLNLHGNGALPTMLAVARACGLRTPSVALKGTAAFDADINGEWAGFAAPLVTGAATVQNVVGEMHGLNAAIRVDKGTLVVTPSDIELQSFTGEVDGTPLDGSVILTRGCDPISSCPARFQMHAAALKTDDLNRWLNPRLQRSSWLPFLGSSRASLARIHAAGQLTVDRLIVKGVTASHVVAHLKIAGGGVEATVSPATIFGGQYSGRWTADFSGNQPSYRGSGNLKEVDASALGGAMRVSLGTGSIAGQVEAAMSGWTASELLATLHASVDFDWRHGVLRHFSPSEAPLTINDFAGHLTLADGLVEITQSKLTSPSGTYAVSGTASFARQLDLKLAREGGPAYIMSGSLDKPHIQPAPPAPEKQAALKQQ